MWEKSPLILDRQVDCQRGYLTVLTVMAAPQQASSDEATGLMAAHTPRVARVFESVPIIVLKFRVCSEQNTETERNLYIHRLAIPIN